MIIIFLTKSALSFGLKSIPFLPKSASASQTIPTAPATTSVLASIFAYAC
jgi:hypothetical protein